MGGILKVHEELLNIQSETFKVRGETSFGSRKAPKIEEALRNLTR